MTRQQAIRTYLDKYRFSDVIIRRLMQWDSKLSVRDNCEKIKTNYNVALAMRKRFKLKYRHVGKGNGRKNNILSESQK